MTVLEAVERSKIPFFMVKGAIKAAQKMISPSEEILWAQMGQIYTKPTSDELITDFKELNSNNLTGVIVVTDQRILFVQSVLGNRTYKEIRLSSVRSVDAKASPMIECLRITSAVDMLIAFAKPSYIALLRNAINDAIERLNTKNTSAQRTPLDDDKLDSSDVEQLQSLKQLYDAGVITAEEFAAKKAQILNL